MRQRRAASFALLLGLAFGLASCTLFRGGAEPVATDQEQSAYRSAIAPLPDDPDEAALRLEQFLNRYPDSPLAVDAAEKLADLSLAAGDDTTAARWLYGIVRRQGDTARGQTARLRLARLEAERGNLESARGLLAQLRFSKLSPEQRRLAYPLLVELAADAVERLRWLAAERRDRAGDPEAEALLDLQIDSLLDVMALEELERAAEQLGDGIPAGRVQLRIARRALDVGDFERAEGGLSEARRDALTPADEALLASLAMRLEMRDLAGSELLPTFEAVAARPLPRTAGADGALGVVLPLTGPLAAYGEESLRGILLAAGIFEPDPGYASAEGVRELPANRGPGADARKRLGLGEEPGLLDGRSGVRLVVRDSAGSPERAANAVAELAADDQVMAIVGPLLARESEAAAVEAEQSEVPILTLTGREAVPRDRANVFRVSTTPGDEVRFLVDYAMRERGARRFAVLYPNDNYGRGMRNRFWKQVEERGGWVVASSGYDPEATDFADPIRRMIGYSLLTRLEKDAIKERGEVLKRARRLPPEEAAAVLEATATMLGPEGEPLPPIVDFDALFIPDAHDKVVLIAPQLAFHEVSDVTLLGPGGWKHPDLVKIARNHVSGGVIAAPFDIDSRFGFVSRFVDAYSATFGTPPDAFAAQAYDAANLVLMQLAAGRDTREGVREGVLAVRGYPGASGVITFLPDGNARKRPFLLGVRGGRMVPLD